MSEQLTQPELDGMPQKKARWLDVCIAGAEDLAFCGLVLGTMPKLPGLEDGDAELFECAARRFTRIVMQEIGRVVYDEAFDVAEGRFEAMFAEALRIAPAESDER